MVRGAISRVGKTDLFDGMAYVGILEQHLLPLIKEKHPVGCSRLARRRLCLQGKTYLRLFRGRGRDGHGLASEVLRLQLY